MKGSGEGCAAWSKVNSELQLFAPKQMGSVGAPKGRSGTSRGKPEAGSSQLNE